MRMVECWRIDSNMIHSRRVRVFPQPNGPRTSEGIYDNSSLHALHTLYTGSASDLLAGRVQHAVDGRLLRLIQLTILQLLEASGNGLRDGRNVGSTSSEEGEVGGGDTSQHQVH